MAESNLLTPAHSEAAAEFGFKQAAKRRSTISIPMMAQALRVADVCLVYGAGTALYELYLTDAGLPAWSAYQLALIAAALMVINIFAIAGVYEERCLTTGRTGIRRAVACWGAALGGMLLAAAVLKVTGDFSRVWFAAWGGSVALGLIFSRALVWTVIQRWIDSGRLSFTVAFYGTGPLAESMMGQMRRSNDRLYRMVGVFDDHPMEGGNGTVPDFAKLEALVRAEKVNMVVVTLPWSDENRIVEALAKLRSLPIDIRLAPSLQLPIPNARATVMAGVPTLDVFSVPISGWGRIAKTAEDMILGSLILLFLSPIMLMIGLAVKLDSPGPIFFKQKRYGYNNRLIQVYKFRSMRQDATDHNAEKLVRPGDTRVTRLGAFLRKSSLDELPQLLNVVRGEMSLVGPRPHALKAKADTRLYEEVVEEYASRHRVKPGITGWAQVNGWRGVTDTEDKIRERVAHDLYYIDNWSVMFDLQILFMTIFAVVKPSNAH